MNKIAGLLVIVLLISATTLTAFAHSGRTDSSGGHRDNKNVSGLGPYHYHCGGYPAHLHSNGVCPYASTSTSSSSSSSSNSAAREESVVYFRDAASSSSSQVESAAPAVEYDAEEAEKHNAEIKEYFQKFFSNDMTVISIGHLSEKNASVTIAYKAELPGLDTTALVFYDYDKDANTYSKIVNPNYIYVDKTLSFTTASNKGFVIISEKEFAKK